MSRFQTIGIGMSVGLHALVILGGGLNASHQAEFSVQSGSGSTEVNLVAGVPEPPKPLQPIPPPPDPDAVSKPAPPSKKIAKSTPPPQSKPAASGSGVTGQAKPDYLHNPPPEYPEFAKEAHQEGVVMLQVSVSETGAVLEVIVKQSSGFQLLDQAALRAVKSWKFKPATMGILAVKSTVAVPIRFKLQ